MSEMVVPDGWDVSELRKHSTRVKLKNSVGNTNILTASAQHGLINQRKFFNKSVASKDTSNYTLLFRGDFAYNKSYSEGYPVGVVRRLSRYDSGILSPLYICFTISSDDCEVDFMSYFFDSYWFERELNSVVQEGARAHGLLNIPVNDFFSRELLLPPLPEQQKIASILTSVDEVIEKTQSQINKLQDLKKGTMNELLTKGIGHTEFKDSPVGKIPKGWGVVSVDDLCAKVFVGIATSTTHAYTDDSGVAILRNQNIKDGRIDSSDLLFITKEFSEENSTKKLQKGDVITARTGYPGISSVVSDNFVGCHSFTTLISRPYQDKVMPEFFARLFNSEQGQYVVSQMQAGGAQQNLNVEMMKKILMPLPSTQEQQQISSILSSIDKNIEEKQHKLEQTQSLKKSLMQDLLTGKVRVPLQ